MSVNGIFSGVDISTSGLQTQGRIMELVSANIANARTTDAGNGQPYRRQHAEVVAGEDVSGGVSISQILEDTSDFRMIFDPGNPQADGNGYVSMPNVDIPVEMMNLSAATRAYQANAAALKRYQQMVETSLELLR